MADRAAPIDIIGADALARLTMAGFRVERDPAREPPPKMVARFTCPHCGYSALGGLRLQAVAERGEAWHPACVPWPPPSPRARGAGESDRRPMRKTFEPREAAGAD